MEQPSPFRVLSRPLGEAPSYWREDPVLRSLLARSLSGEAMAWLEPQLARMGELAAGSLDRLAREADRSGPVLRPRDPLGERLDEVVYHPSYRELERVAYGAGLVGLKYDPAVRRAHPGEGHRLGFALSFLFAQAESGLYCPVCMTDGAARVIERLGSEEQRRRIIPRLAARELDQLWTGAMFLTERQGGSDVGAVATRAVRDGDRWRLFGEKWFCSNVDAQAILTLARPEGAGPGTRGLGLFFVNRDLPGGQRNGLRIDRLKDKLGVRSMPTGEVTLEGAIAELVGPVDAGFKAMTEMINLSRVYNAFASVAVMRRAVYEATRYLRARNTFGKPAISHPLVRQNLADLHAEEIGAKLLVFKVAEHLDRADAGSAPDAHRVRVLTPLVKYTTAKLAVWAASECLELHGGNGYIEDFVTPRLLRDAQVLPVWEGTTNILVLDAMRACQRGAAHELLLGDIEQRCREAPAALREEARQVGALAGSLVQELRSLTDSPPDSQAGRQRRWTDRLTLGVTLGLLFEAAGRAGPDEAMLVAAARRLVQRHLAPERELTVPELADLVERTVA